MMIELIQKEIISILTKMDKNSKIIVLVTHDLGLIKYCTRIINMSDGRIISDKNRYKCFLKEWIIPICLALIIAVLINKFIFFNVYVPTESMVPTINKDDKILVLRKYNEIKHGEILVFYSEEFSETFIKRVIGVPGDHIEIKNGIICRNGKQIEENYVKNNEAYDGVFDVPKDKYFFLGDNRSNSKDSRVWMNPYIDRSEIKGVAYIKFYPFSDIEILK